MAEVGRAKTGCCIRWSDVSRGDEGREGWGDCACEYIKKAAGFSDKNAAVHLLHCYFPDFGRHRNFGERTT